MEESPSGMKTPYTPVEDNQPALFASEELEQWRKEWTGMPEYENKKMDAYKTVIVRFRNQEDVDDFCKRLEQDVTDATTNIWHPRLERVLYGEHYVSKS